MKTNLEQITDNNWKELPVHLFEGNTAAFN
jgi:hypothetical protein